jgi:hypothetical protein
MSFVVERGGFTEMVNAEHVGLSETTLFFFNGEKTPENVVKTFNNHGGWQAFTEVSE